jgi:hypothetical protein
MTTCRPNILPVCACAAIAAVAIASQAVASTPAYSEDFNSYNTDTNLIGQNHWARAGVPNSPSIPPLPKGINTTPAVAKNLLATKDSTAAELKGDPFKFPASGIFSCEFDTQRDTGSSGSVPPHSRVFAANQTWSNTCAVSGNWSAIPFHRVISGSSCADVGSLIVPARSAWRKFKLLKGRKMLRDD